jgi:hypothetical protein
MVRWPLLSFHHGIEREPYRAASDERRTVTDLTDEMEAPVAAERQQTACILCEPRRTPIFVPSGVAIGLDAPTAKVGNPS